MSSLEMQACGLPVLASDLQGTPETVDDGVSGIVTRAGDPQELAAAIAALIDDPEGRMQMSVAARRRIEEGFTRAHQIAKLARGAGDSLR